MTTQPGDLKYTKTHEWVRRRGQQIEVGITDFAQHQLSDITYVELPAVGEKFTVNKEAVVVESIKAASDVYAPVAGVITEVNASLAATPEVINSDPYGAGWLFRMTPDLMTDVEMLMDGGQYEFLLPKEH
ncbi:MAG: glycine cleavage system protein GcvH [Verrucomicrobia bacterium]|nr:glycine cleavage system protein GcvH [Verrucomicrobiota bacterium]MCG2681194.1 glycine cleavage system protein GcvH [Kiritimatiellia bacterium]MBU4246776.1 glycine cleavage system protein GcvH [Verrucomicrobiota bacterium]MBU4290590.1 glycine cleavage system protein GcvH [Verrucomicrobiota bacterium]MBU4429731.1 glycine cleavage system protein GcvH [Verrucomicrobiota bacterium]